MYGIGEAEPIARQETSKEPTNRRTNYLEINNILDSILTDNAIHKNVTDTDDQKSEISTCIYGRISD